MAFLLEGVGVGVRLGGPTQLVPRGNVPAVPPTLALPPPDFGIKLRVLGHPHEVSAGNQVAEPGHCEKGEEEKPEAEWSRPRGPRGEKYQAPQGGTIGGPYEKRSPRPDSGILLRVLGRPQVLAGNQLGGYD